MDKEIEAATWFWASQLNAPNAVPLSHEQINNFRKSLSKALHEKYDGHWYLNDPDRGHAFRSIMFENGRMDALLEIAARRSRISDLAHRLPAELIMWVDPGSVKVQYKLVPNKQHVIYSTSAGMNDSRVVDAASCRTPGILNLESTVLSVNSANKSI